MIDAQGLIGREMPLDSFGSLAVDSSPRRKSNYHKGLLRRS